MIQKTAKIFTF